MFKRAYALALAAAVLTVGCNQTTPDSGSTSTSTTTTTSDAPATTSAAPSAPAGGAAAGGQVHKLASGLQYEDQMIGSGKMAEAGMSVSIIYTGRLTDGTQFDSNANGGQPLKFQVGGGQMIAGFDEGVKGMRIGGKRKLTIPADLGYGDAGRPGIPPKATLLFDIELIDAQ